MKHVPRRTSYYGPEDLDMFAIFEWIGLHPDIVPDAHHVANEGKRSIMERVKLKRMGFTNGFSDIFLAIPMGPYHGLFIEHKAKQKSGQYGKPTMSQLQFIDRKNMRGYFATVTQGVDDAINTLKWYLSL